MKELTIVKISDTLVRLTCEGGRVCDTRTMKMFSEVECLKDEIRYFKAV